MKGSFFVGLNHPCVCVYMYNIPSFWNCVRALFISHRSVRNFSHDSCAMAQSYESKALARFTLELHFRSTRQPYTARNYSTSFTRNLLRGEKNKNGWKKFPFPLNAHIPPNQELYQFFFTFCTDNFDAMERFKVNENSSLHGLFTFKTQSKPLSDESDKNFHTKWTQSLTIGKYSLFTVSFLSMFSLLSRKFFSPLSAMLRERF